MASDLTALPATITGGTTVEYRLTLPDYPASVWDMTLLLVGPTPASQVASKDGDTHVITLSAAKTGGLAGGVYTFTHRATSNGVVEDAETGVVRLNVDPAQVTDGRTDNEKALAVARAAFSGTLADGMQSFQLFGRAVAMHSPKELLDVIARLERAVAAERRRKKGRSPLGRVIPTSFGSRG